MSGRRNRSRKQVTNAKEGLLELRRKKCKVNVPGVTGKAQVCSQEGEHAGYPVLRVLRISISTEYSSAFQIYPLGLWSLMIGLHEGSRSLGNAAGPNISHGISCLVLLLFCA